MIKIKGIPKDYSTLLGKYLEECDGGYIEKEGAKIPPSVKKLIEKYMVRGDNNALFPKSEIVLEEEKEG